MQMTDWSKDLSNRSMNMSMKSTVLESKLDKECRNLIEIRIHYSTHLHLRIVEIVKINPNENVHILTRKFPCRIHCFFLLFSFSKFLRRENLDAKVYLGNVPTEKLTDEELLDLVKPFGKVSGKR